MTFILAAVTLFCVVLIVLDRIGGSGARIQIAAAPSMIEMYPIVDDDGFSCIYFCMLCTPSSMRYEGEMDEHMRERHQIGPEWRQRIRRCL